MAKQKVKVTNPKYHAGKNMVYHAASPLGHGAVFREAFGYGRYRVTLCAYDQVDATHTAHHTLAWAKRMLRKGLGGSW